MEYRIEDLFDVSAQRYWDTFFDPTYTSALHEALDITYALLEDERTGAGDDLVITRRQRLTPHRNVPRMIETFVKGAISYTETSKFARRDNQLTTQTVPSFAADKIDNHGTYRIEEVGEGQVRRVWDGVCRCTIPFAGRKIEAFLVDEIRESYRKATDFTRQWFTERV